MSDDLSEEELKTLWVRGGARVPGSGHRVLVERAVAELRRRRVDDAEYQADATREIVRLARELERVTTRADKLAEMYTTCELALHDAMPSGATYGTFLDGVRLVVSHVKAITADRDTALAQRDSWFSEYEAQRIATAEMTDERDTAISALAAVRAELAEARAVIADYERTIYELHAERREAGEPMAWAVVDATGSLPCDGDTVDYTVHFEEEGAKTEADDHRVRLWERGAFPTEAECDAAVTVVPLYPREARKAAEPRAVLSDAEREALAWVKSHCEGVAVFGDAPVCTRAIAALNRVLAPPAAPVEPVVSNCQSPAAMSAEAREAIDDVIGAAKAHMRAPVEPERAPPPCNHGIPSGTASLSTPHYCATCKLWYGDATGSTLIRVAPPPSGPVPVGSPAHVEMWDAVNASAAGHATAPAAPVKRTDCASCGRRWNDCDWNRSRHTVHPDDMEREPFASWRAACAEASRAAPVPAEPPRAERCERCGRAKARNVVDVMKKFCPREWAPRDAAAEADCDREARLLPYRTDASAPAPVPPATPHPGESTVVLTINGQPRDIDASIAPIVRALNAAGIATVASCSGHGKRPGNVALADGRELIIARSFEERRAVDRAFPDIHGVAPKVTPAMLIAAKTANRAYRLREDREWKCTDDDAIPAILEAALRTEEPAS